MRITWTCLMLLDDDTHNILACINGKVISFWCKVANYISAYLLPPPSHTRKPPIPSDNHPFLPLKKKPLIFSDSCLCPTVCTSQFIPNSTTAESILGIWYRYMKVYGSLGKELGHTTKMAAMPIYDKIH